MDLGLQRRVALVTGASRGLGRAIAEGLAAEGARVAVASRSLDELEALATAIGGRAYRFDSDDLATVGPLIDAVERDLGPVEVYVANTGGPPAGRDPLGFAPEQWESAHRTLVVAPMAVMSRVVPGMRRRRWGRVLVVSSSAAREPIAGLQLSNANRAGLLAAMKHLAREGAADGVTFNAVLPGRIATDRLIAMHGSLADAEDAARGAVPAGRLGRPAELADAAVFLCSDRAAYVTGQSLLVDGGLTRSW